ncbi:hypothetical protein Tco_0596392 [Tanacetum coccineum]
MVLGILSGATIRHRWRVPEDITLLHDSWDFEVNIYRVTEPAVCVPDDLNTCYEDSILYYRGHRQDSRTSHITASNYGLAAGRLAICEDKIASIRTLTVLIARGWMVCLTKRLGPHCRLRIDVRHGLFARRASRSHRPPPPPDEHGICTRVSAPCTSDIATTAGYSYSDTSPGTNRDLLLQKCSQAEIGQRLRET